jgi:hypothetical protein
MSVEDLQQEGFNLRKSVHVRHDVVLPLIDIHRKGWIEGLSYYLQVTCTYPPSHYDLFIYHNERGVPNFSYELAEIFWRFPNEFTIIRTRYRLKIFKVGN